MECENGSKSVHAFIEKKFGAVYKPASWKAPAKHIRFTLLDDNSREECFARCDWAGGYLWGVSVEKSRGKKPIISVDTLFLMSFFKHPLKNIPEKALNRHVTMR